jgi:hypothetical protein
VESFVENFLDYMQEIGRKTGASYIVLPLHNIGALSNRLEICEYLKKKYGGVERVSLKDDIDFNGYKIKDSCIIVRTVAKKRTRGKVPKPSNVPVKAQDQWVGSW